MKQRPQDPATPASSPPTVVPLLACGALFVVVAALLQILGQVPFDADTAYHVAVARLIARHGILHAFPWTPFSWLADHYADKEILFHLLLVPVAGLPYAVAAKLVGTLLGAALLGVMAFVLHRERVPRAWIWPLVALASSGLFALRFTLVRPHLVAIALALLGTWAAAGRRRGVLFGVGVLYPLAYIAWHTLLVIVVIAEVARLASGQRPAGAAAGAAAGGLVTGLLIHPNFPAILGFWWIVHAEILLRTAWGGREGFDLGPEFAPLGLPDLLRFGLVPFAFAAAGAVLAWRKRREDTTALAFALATLAFAVLALRTARFFEYLVPFATVALALGLRGLPRTERSAATVLAAATLFTLAFGAQPFRDLARRGDDFPPPLVEALRRVVPAGAQIFTCDWGLTGEMMLALPERRFIVALDPVLFYRKDPARYRLWYATVHRPPPDAARVAREAFGARYVLCDARPEWRPFLAVLRRDPSTRLAIGSRLWVLVDLAPPAAP